MANKIRKAYMVLKHKMPEECQLNTTPKKSRRKFAVNKFRTMFKVVLGM